MHVYMLKCECTKEYSKMYGIMVNWIFTYLNKYTLIKKLKN